MANFKAGTQRDYIIPLKAAINRNYAKKANKAVLEVRRFVIKHTRIEDIVLTNEVNHFIWQTGKFKIPKKVPVTLKESGGKVLVYLQGSKQMEVDVKKAKETEAKKKAEATGLVEKAKEKAKDVEAEEKRKLAEKKVKEKASQTAALKKGQK